MKLFSIASIILIISNHNQGFLFFSSYGILRGGKRGKNTVNIYYLVYLKNGNLSVS